MYEPRTSGLEGSAPSGSPVADAQRKRATPAGAYPCNHSCPRCCGTRAGARLLPPAPRERYVLNQMQAEHQHLNLEFLGASTALDLDDEPTAEQPIPGDPSCDNCGGVGA